MKRHMHQVARSVEVDCRQTSRWVNWMRDERYLETKLAFWTQWMLLSQKITNFVPRLDRPNNLLGG